MCKIKLKPVYSYIKQETHLCRQWLHFRILMRKIRLETTLAETLFPSTTWTLKRWAPEENLEGINLSSRHKYDPQAHKHRVANYNAMVRILLPHLTLLNTFSLNNTQIFSQKKARTFPTDISYMFYLDTLSQDFYVFISFHVLFFFFIFVCFPV